MSKPADKDAMACNKPRRTPGHAKKSHVVKACFDGKEKLIRFGEQGASTAGKPKAGESERMKTKRASFKSRHAKNIAKGPSSPAYWANKVKWAEGGEVKMAAGGSAALALIEQMRRSAGQSPEFDPTLVAMREQRARPARRPAPQAAPRMSEPQAAQPREAPLPLPPVPPAMRPDENPPPEAPRNPMRFDEGNPHVATAIRMAEKYNLPRDIFLSLVQQESRFDPNARSRRGAIGLGQLMPGTARELGVDPTDPEQNLEGSARYLRQMLDRFKDMPLALAAYNAGPGRVARAGNTIPNIRETQQYVPSILRRAGANVPEGFAEGGLADLEQKYAEGGAVAAYNPEAVEALVRSIEEPEGYAEGGRVRRTLRDELRDIEADIRGERPASLGVTVARGFGEGASGIVSPATARAIQMTTRLPQDERFLRAVEGTPGARITDDGLELEVLRYQKPEQAGAQAIREGVFYLPATLPARNLRAYRGTDTAAYGGPEMVRGETLLRAPLAVPGPTGGAVPERAYRELTSDADLQRLISDVRSAANAPLRGGDYYRNIENLLEEYGGNPDLATELVNASRVGNRMRYALQEHLIGNRARREGYDSIVGTGARTPRISEVFDLREAAYPVPGVPEMEMLLPRYEELLRGYAEGGEVESDPQPRGALNRVRNYLYNTFMRPNDMGMEADARAKAEGIPGGAGGPRDAIRHMIASSYTSPRGVAAVEFLQGDTLNSLVGDNQATWDRANNALGQRLRSVPEGERYDRAKNMVLQQLRHLVEYGEMSGSLPSFDPRFTVVDRNAEGREIVYGPREIIGWIESGRMPSLSDDSRVLRSDIYTSGSIGDRLRPASRRERAPASVPATPNNFAEGGLAQLEQKYAEGGEVSAMPYNPDAVDALVKEIEAEYV